MKVEKAKPKKGVSDLPPITKELIVRLQSCTEEELIEILKGTTVWRYGKCELYHWIDVLDRFDGILAESAKLEQDADTLQCLFMCPKLQEPKIKDKVVTVLNFTSLLIEHSYARHIYNSTEHLCVMLACPDLDVVLAVLNLFYVFSKRSNFISRLPPKQRTSLNSYLEYLGETWGGKQNGFGLAACCQNVKPLLFPSTCTTVYFEYVPFEGNKDTKVDVMKQASGSECVILENVDKMEEDISGIMAGVLARHRIPPVKQMQLLTRLRLARNFPKYTQRLKCVMARLQAISILVYSAAPADIVDPLVYDSFVEELVEVLEIRDTHLMEIRAAVLRTLTAIIHLERDPRLGTIIEATGAATYHGFLPALVRDCVASFTIGSTSVGPISTSTAEEFPISFATALFSFLYHLATYEASGDALVSSGIMESLLQVLEWKAFEPMNITLVTRAVRVIDLITNLDMSAFHSLGGWDKMLSRLKLEVRECRKEVPTILSAEVKPAEPVGEEGEGAAEPQGAQQEHPEESVPMETGDMRSERLDSTLSQEAMEVVDASASGTTTYQCMPEQAALIKSILNFLKKAIPDPMFTENIRNFVDSSLPQSLKHIVSNAEYYGPSIYLPATEVTTVFIFHEPSQLSSLQDNGLPGVILNSIINKKIPVTREVLSSLPNVLSALCLNSRGLQVFVKAKPFDHLFGVLITPNYLPAMRKKKGADQIGDTASNLGIAMDELMRHQPTLRSSVITALIRLLQKLCEMGDATTADQQTEKSEADKQKLASEAVVASDDHMSSDSDNDDDDGEGSHSSDKEEGQEDQQEGDDAGEQRSEKASPPLTEYVINVVHFVDAILSNNSTDDHIREFITQGGLAPLLRIFSLPTLPLDFPTSSACSAITNTCRGILNIAHAPELLQESLTQLEALLNDLTSFLNSPQNASNSVLLGEIGPLCNMSTAIKSPNTTPILHRLVAVNAFIQLFIHLSRASQVGYNIESRALCVNHWSSTLGHSVLQQLSKLYRALVWEGFILLAVAADEDKVLREREGTKPLSDTQSDSQISKPQDSIPDSRTHSGSIENTVATSSSSVSPTTSQSQSANVSISMETTTSGTLELKSIDQSSSSPTVTPSVLVQSLKQLTPLLTVTSRVGRALAELMSLLVRICTSPLHRPHRRGPGHMLVHTYHPPSEDAINVCLEVTNLLVDSLKWEVPMPQACRSAMQSPIRDWLFAGMTFKMYAVDFCELLLFDEHKQSYHMMQYAFEKKSALAAFVRTFQAAVRIVNENTEMGSVYWSSSEFLEAWLNLAEKLVNASAILESSHSLPLPPPSQTGGKKLLFNPLFNPLAFVIQAQKAVFPCLQELWGSPQLTNLSPKVVELLISTIRHLYSSERVIEAKLTELKNVESTDGGASSGGGASSSSSSSRGAQASSSVSVEAPPLHRVDQAFLQQLCDMGFARNHAEVALIACANDLTSAMEWILSHPPPPLAVAAEPAPLSEEEQILQAIALSLSQDKDSEDEKKKAEEKKRKEEEDKKRKEEEEERRRREELKPLDKSLLDDFSNNLLSGCIELASSVAESVYRICDIVVSLAKRNGPEWRNMALDRVKAQVLLSVESLIDQIESGNYVISQVGIDPVACQIHLLALMMEEMPLACAQVVCEPELLSSCIKLLHVAQTKVCNLNTSEPSTPRWLSPLLLLLDLWEKTVMLAQWHTPAKQDDAQIVWQWFENIHGKWCTYSSENSQQIEKAYQEGESTVKISSGRQRYIVQFGPMVQVNTETNTQRPVTRLQIPKKGKNDKEKSTSQAEGATASELQSHQRLHPTCLSQDQANTAIKCCTRLLSVPLNPDTLHANLRLCLRLTRKPELAVTFSQEGGLRALLSLTHKSAFRGFTSLSALLFRHCLEEGPLLNQTMESVIRSVVNNPSSNSKEFRTQGMGSRELHYVLRRLGPCACRDPELFTNTACSILRMTNQPPKPENYVSQQRVPPTMLKCVGLVKADFVPLYTSQHNLINLLIDHLCSGSFFEEPLGEGGNGDAMKPDEDAGRESVHRRFSMRTGGRGQPRRRRVGSYLRQAGNFDIDDDVVSEDMNVDTEVVSESAGVTGSTGSTTEGEGSSAAVKTDKETEKPLLSKAAVLRLLAELVESYPPCAKLIAESSRNIKIHGQPAKEMPVLAFIFNHLLPASFTQTTGIPTIAKLAKSFLQCLATAHHSPDAVSVLIVAEFKMAFARALVLPESQMKHSRIRALTGLLSQVLEAQNVFTSRGTITPTHFARLLIRKGFISDLARAVHCLNLNSIYLPATVNSILKPLEVLTKIVNTVSSTQPRKTDTSESKSTATPLGVRDTRAEQITTTSTTASTTTTSRPQVIPGLTATSEQDPTQRTPSGTATRGVSSIEVRRGNQERPPASESILEATHESLIPLEEEEGLDISGERHGGAEMSLMDGGIIEELVNELLETEPVVADTSVDPHDSEELLSGDSFSDSEEDEEDIDEDKCNSAGEEVEDEFEESQVEGTPPGTMLADPDHDDDHDIDSDLSDVESTQDDTEVEEEGEEEGEETGETSSAGSSAEEEEEEAEEEEEEEEEAMMEGEGGGSEAVEGEGEVTFDLGEEGDEMDDEDELDLEYGYDDDDEETDYLHVDMPWGWRGDPDMDIQPHSFHSILTRAYHSRPSQHVSDLDQTSSNMAHALPQYHPLLVRHADHPQQQVSRGSSGSFNSATPAEGQHEASSAMQQLLSNINAAAGTNEVLSFGVGTSSGGQRTRGAQISPLQLTDDGSESTTIPSAQQRWEEESNALDGHIAHLCIANLREEIISKLTEHYEKDNKPKEPPKPPPETTAALKPPEEGRSGHTSGGVPTGPLPSDQATPSSPRDTSSTVDQLRSSLRQVADALAQTVAAVRSTREQLSGRASGEPAASGTQESEEVAMERDQSTGEAETRSLTRDEESSMETSDSSASQRLPPELIPVLASPPPPAPLPPPLPSTTTAPPHTTSTSTPSNVHVPILSTFDGSQESARATLASTDPEDPLYTFLSAVAGAPAPPLPETSTSLSPPSDTIQTTSSPRLPVFAQFQSDSQSQIRFQSDSQSQIRFQSDSQSQIRFQSDSQSQISSIPMPVIQDVRNLDAAAMNTRELSTAGESQPLLQSTEAVPTDSQNVTENVSSLAASIASRMTNFFELPLEHHDHGSSTEESSILQSAVLADSLAQELARAVTQLVPTSDSSTTSTATTTTLSAPIPPRLPTHSTGQSPSPSDTLAPLISSLQMPTSSASSSHPMTGGEGVVGDGVLSSEIVSEEPSGEESTALETVAASLTPAQFHSTSDTTGQSSSGATAAAAETEPQDELDPTFLAALPDQIRQEVIAQHERDLRVRRAQQQVSSSISAEFLAALPLSIQEEVIQQERQERARQVSQQSNPTDPMDNASFFTNLPLELRRNILADMDDSMINHLPEELATEARSIRQDRESRRRQMFEQRHAFLERMVEQAEMVAQSGGIPYPSWTSSMDPSGYRYAVLNLNPHHLLEGHHHMGASLRFGMPHATLSQSKTDQNSKQMLDQEALSCLLLLLFLDQNKLHNNRLHRIVKNLAQHLPTRSWILSSLLAIITETTCSTQTISSTCPMPPPLTPLKHSTDTAVLATSTPIAPHIGTLHWLNVTISAALGSHARIFKFEHSGKIGTSAKVHVHPLASITVCNNVLDLLVFLSRSFSGTFLPPKLMPKDSKDKGTGGSKTSPDDTDEASDVISNFWQVLMRLDGAASRKGKGALKAFQYSESNQSRTACELFSSSIIGRLMSLLQHDVIKDSIPLTDKLLRVLSVSSCPIPKSGLSLRRPVEVSATTAAETQRTSTGATLSTATENEDIFVSEAQSTIVDPSLLKIAVGVLTSGRCSEDGLDDATHLLSNLSRCSMGTRELILMMLLDGVRTIGLTLCSQISILLDDLGANMAALKIRRKSVDPSMFSATEPGPSSGNVLPGIVLPSVTQDQHTDHSRDLHLPTMVPLTCKGSQQSFFLRMLKVVCQLRESAQLALKAKPVSQASQTDDAVVPVMYHPLGVVIPPPPPSAGGPLQSSSAGEPERSPSPPPAISGPPPPPSAGGPLHSSSAGEPERSPSPPPAISGPPPPPSTASPLQSSSAGEPERSMEQDGDQQTSSSNSAQKDKSKTEEQLASKLYILQSLSLQLELEELWSTLSDCLDALEETKDPHSVLVLQPTVEAFFLVHADRSEEGKPLPRRIRGSSLRGRVGRLSSFHTISDTESNPASPAPNLDLSPMPGTPGPSEPDVESYAHLPPDTARFLMFAEKHRTVLNQILRQSTIPLAEGPFAVLVNYTKILDFDIKRRYFRQELDQLDDGVRRDDVVLHLRRDHIFEDSFRELFRRSPEELKGGLYIQFDGEEGQDAGGLLREWYLIIAREMFNPNYALFKTTPGDRVTYMPNPSSNVNPNHLNYFKFIGRVIAKAIYDNKLLDSYFTRSFYKHILGKPVHYTDMEAEDYTFYMGMVYLLEHDLNEIGMDLVFSMEVQEFGKTEVKDMKTNGRNIAVTEANKREYVQLACQMKMTGSIRTQIKSFLEGFYEIIPKDLISIFNEQEMELLISGLPTIDIDDLKANTEYHKYTENSLQVQWFWRAMRSLDQADRARFLQFLTGTSKVPLQGFAALEGMNGIQKFQIHRDDRSTDRLPCAHTCFNQLDLPAYETYDKLRSQLLIAIRECPEGFGFA